MSSNFWNLHFLGASKVFQVEQLKLEAPKITECDLKWWIQILQNSWVLCPSFPKPCLQTPKGFKKPGTASADHWAGADSHGKRHAASAAAECYLLHYWRADAALETPGYCILWVIQAPFSPHKISPSPAKNLYPQTLIFSNDFFQVTCYFSLEHMFSFWKQMPQELWCQLRIYGYICSCLWHWDNYFFPCRCFLEGTCFPEDCMKCY